MSRKNVHRNYQPNNYSVIRKNILIADALNVVYIHGLNLLKMEFEENPEN